MEYADQRYYASNFGRFTSPDPYRASAGPRDPASWNRYSYVKNDPLNAFDPSGRWNCDPNMICGDGGGGPYCDEGEGEGGPQDCTGDGGGGNSGTCNATQGLASGLTYWCLHQSGNDYDDVKSEFKALTKALKNDPKCANWLGTNAGKGGLNKKISNVKFSLSAGITTSDGTYADNVAVTLGDVMGVDIVFNDAGAFFSPGATEGNLFNILIHELAHILGAPGFILDDANVNPDGSLTPASAAAEASNQALIVANCAKTISLQ